MSSVLNPAVVFRRRSGWEASDMGIFLWRTNCFPILFFTAIPSIILFAVNIMAARLDINWLSRAALFCIWWIKPLLDRFSLHVISIRFFEPVYSSQNTSFRRLFRGLGKTIRTGLPGDLLWRRLSLFRSAVMPLRVLERLKESNYNRRKQLLARNGLGFGRPLTLICLSMLTALNAGELVFLNSVFNMINGAGTNVFDFMNENKSLVSLLYLLNEILVETLYVCMGFSLYINSRVQTEGWDIELLFKTCVEKNKKSFRTAHNYKRMAAFVIPVLLFLSFPCRSFAIDTGSQVRQKAGIPEQKQQNCELLKPPPVSEEDENTLLKVFEDPKYGTEKESRKIRFKQKNIRPRGFIRLPSESPFREIMGHILRFAAIAVIITALCLAVYFTYRHRKRFFRKTAEGKSSIDDHTPEDCQKLLQQAEECYRKGKIREAWALCFRAFIGIFAKLWFVPFPAEATEYESLALVRKNYSSSVASNNVKYFEDFIHHWIIFAYGGQEPETGSFEQAVASCKTLLEYRENGE